MIISGRQRASKATRPASRTNPADLAVTYRQRNQPPNQGGECLRRLVQERHGASAPRCIIASAGFTASCGIRRRPKTPVGKDRPPKLLASKLEQPDGSCPWHLTTTESMTRL